MAHAGHLAYLAPRERADPTGGAPRWDHTVCMRGHVEHTFASALRARSRGEVPAATSKAARVRVRNALTQAGPG